MEDTITGSTQWVQSYDSSFYSPLPFSGTTAATASVDGTSLSSNNSYRAIDHHHQHQLSPKSSGCVSKPIRRRSRASKRTPTTLLNANTTNFRDLVQQFTGRPRTPFSFASHKGPITLNFGAANDHDTNSGSINFLDMLSRQQLPEQENRSQRNGQPQQQQHHGLEQMLDNVSNDASDSAAPNVEFGEEDLVLDDFFLDEVTREYLFSNGYSQGSIQGSC